MNERHDVPLVKEERLEFESSPIIRRKDQMDRSDLLLYIEELEQYIQKIRGENGQSI